ncbi:MAG: aminotransferase class III-fold pyridoxal phosphate-dependent enzyme [Actinobacteria bacterium]|nr:aminotransferase class III-fold pyridoxal phosphate-dependent enzyme [Actinomycetota bacterium]
MGNRPALATFTADSEIEQTYRRRTPNVAEIFERAKRSLPGGSTRAFGYFRPYPLTFERGAGPYLWDLDGNRYVDFTYNGLSLIHGHAFPPVEEALREALPNATAWPGTSLPQIRFAEALCERIPSADRVRFTNTGTEAGMLAVKLARHATGRPLMVKSWGAYHGSYDDLEAGLYGNGEMPGRTVLGRFGDIDSYREVFARHRGEIAGVIIEPILFTFEVVPPPPGFLPELAALARAEGAVVILDDCLMFRLALGGSAEKFGIEPDLTCLGKFIGGGLPVGVVAGREELLAVLDPDNPEGLYHGGSFNGNPLGATAGRVTLEHLGAGEIAAMDRRAERLKGALERKAAAVGIPLEVTGDGSILGSYVVGAGGSPDRELGARFHLASINHGVYFGQDGEFALATTLDDEALERAVNGLEAALDDLAAEPGQSAGLGS